MYVEHVVEYEYPYILHFPAKIIDPPTLEEVQNWAEQSNFDCIVYQYVAFFKTDHDLNFFILRWL